MWFRSALGGCVDIVLCALVCCGKDVSFWLTRSWCLSVSTLGIAIAWIALVGIVWGMSKTGKNRYKKGGLSYSVSAKKLSNESNRLYKAEYKLKKRVWEGEPESADDFTAKAMGIGECQEFADMVISSDFVRRSFGPHAKIIVSPGSYYDSAQASIRDTNGKRVVRYVGRVGLESHIRLPLWARNEFIILHEIAHHLHSVDAKYYSDAFRHDSEFAGIFLALVREFCHSGEAEELGRRFLKNGIWPAKF